MAKNMRDLRAALQQARPKMQNRDREFLDSIEDAHEKSSHQADLRRVRNRIVGKVKEIIEAPGDSSTAEILDGWYAYMDILDAEIEAKVAFADASGGGSTGGGWYDADTGKAIRVYAPSEAIAASARMTDPDNPAAKARLPTSTCTSARRATCAACWRASGWSAASATSRPRSHSMRPARRPRRRRRHDHLRRGLPRP